MCQPDHGIRIVIATKNRGKIREIKDFFKDTENVMWVTYDAFSFFPEVIEGDRSFIENAKTKARIVSEFTGLASLADDSGLVVDALKGAPGVTSSRYAGMDASDSENRQKLLGEMSGLRSTGQRKARFVCKMIIWDPERGMIASTAGICEGIIGFEEKGTGGFGYDSIFIPYGYNRTMAELSRVEKNSISHRGRALKKLEPLLKKYLDPSKGGSDF